MDFNLSEFILEVRTKPDPEVIDRLGKIVPVLGAAMAVSEWKIENARTEVFDKVEDLRAFVSFRNFGLVIRRPATDHYFSDQSGKFLKVLTESKSVREPIPVERLGVRIRTALSTPLSFEQAVSRYHDAVAPVPDTALEALGGTLHDMSAPIYVKTPLGTLHTTSGPMDAEQLAQFFPFAKREALPKVAFYLDLDRWETPGQERTAKDLASRIRRFTEESIAVSTRFAGLLAPKG